MATDARNWQPQTWHPAKDQRCQGGKKKGQFEKDHKKREEKHETLFITEIYFYFNTVPPLTFLNKTQRRVKYTTVYFWVSEP